MIALQHPARERWRTVTIDPAYEVSDHGRVRRASTGRLRAPAVNSRGYLKLNLSRIGRGRQRQAYVHQLVAAAFLGERPSSDHDVDHLDFDRTNNTATNLRWLVHAENAVRWAARTPDGRNVWAHRDDTPDDHQPLHEDEHAAIAAELDDAGWHDLDPVTAALADWEQQQQQGVTA